MSTRQLRKLRKQQELQTLQGASHDDKVSSDDDHDKPVRVKPSANVFSAFAALGGGGEDEEDEQEEGSHDQTQGEAHAEKLEEPRVETPTSGKKSKRSKKKNRKKTQIPTETEPLSQAEGDIDEIDRAIQELSLERSSQPQPADEHNAALVESSQRLSALLRINFQHLKVINEMRRVFGKEAIEAAQAEEESEANTRRSQRARQGQQQVDLETFLRGIPGKGISEVLLRRNPFIDGRSHWPRASAGGLTMTTTGNPNGDCVEFSFSHDSAYDILEAKFFGLVQMYDPMQLVYFLNQNPYHISTLIQVSKVAKQDQNSALSAELCERALFSLGRVTLSPFRKKLEQGKARMDFHRPENRQFWLAGHNYIKTLVMKGTYRTALEWTKLFLGISPDDPYGMINWIHVLAIRTHEAQWFIDLCDTELLGEKENQIQTGVYIKQTLVLAKLQRGDTSGAEAALIQGMEQLPWLYEALFSALNLDTPPSVWGVQPRGADETLHTQLYIHMAKDLWNNAQATALLFKAGGAARKVDASALPPAPLVTLETARFIYLDNTPALMALVPHGLLHATPNFDFDPLPPPKEENIFSSRSQELPWISTAQGGGFATRFGLMDMEPMPGQIPDDQLRELEQVVNDENVPEDARGVLRRLLDLFVPSGAEAANNESDSDDPTPRLPGAWDFDDVDLWGLEEDFEGEDDFGDMPELEGEEDDFGDTADDDGIHRQASPQGRGQD
ncbi:transcriptional repressor TCF25-domain-containing protein [Phialemonium atrogriseum]|uniref:Transcriptional repressor TCF25-domain-containing protein n=1 Tax=Phialemonium atrogriseum TaxID=1093897 RepID=A0AAJ0CBA5_9PEZI|nr:transcriptional repressor TCF25-domain-containing protein [Phialemonium atrogriseum]KAK1772338.1 transcriptional repressor TCF25-domain-containing protein [Phialemonium atrogriseum]